MDMTARMKIDYYWPKGVFLAVAPEGFLFVMKLKKPIFSKRVTPLKKTTAGQRAIRAEKPIEPKRVKKPYYIKIQKRVTVPKKTIDLKRSV